MNLIMILSFPAFQFNVEKQPEHTDMCLQLFLRILSYFLKSSA